MVIYKITMIWIIFLILNEVRLTPQPTVA